MTHDPSLAVGQAVELGLATADGDRRFRCSVQAHEPTTDRIVVSWPQDGPRLLPVRPGQRLTIELSRAGDAFYTRDTLLDSASTEEPPELALLPTGPWRRYQRRQSSRRSVELRPARAARLLEDGGSMSAQVSVADLSAGGMRVQSNLELSVGDQLELAFAFPGGGAELWLRVLVVRVDRTAPGGAGRGAWGRGRIANRWLDLPPGGLNPAA
jgi:c-di-GMP-binding flagellar brake protein YcgR